MSALGQMQFEQEVLFSMMQDSVNVLLRTEVRPKGLLLEETGGDDFTVRLIVEYLPRMARAVRLEEASITHASVGDEVSLWLRLPEATIEDELLAFLRWFIAAGIARGGIAAQAEAQLDSVFLRVATKVASAWKTVGF